MDTEKLSSSSESSSESDSFLETQHTPPHPRTPWFWIISTIFFSLLSVVLLFKTGLGKPCPTSQRAWRRSDLAAAREVIEAQDVKFTGNSAFDDHGRIFVPNPSPVDYVGATPETDAAWKNLTLDGQRDFAISEKEAKELWPNDYMAHFHRKKENFIVGLDVFHTLHCLNNLRMFYYPEIYPIKPEHTEAIALHRGHCIDQIRQYVMCAGDMTPYGTRWFPNPGRYYADSDVTHTCRNFGKLQEWTANRYHAGGSVHIPGTEIWSPFKDGV